MQPKVYFLLRDELYLNCQQVNVMALELYYLILQLFAVFF
jgi:hypothetical protein